MFFIVKQGSNQIVFTTKNAYINSLAPGRFGCNFKNSIFKLALLIGTLRASSDKVLRWMIQDLTDKSTLVQVMAWCRQATSHYLSQCWPRSMSPYGIIRPQCVNKTACSLNSVWYLGLLYLKRRPEGPVVPHAIIIFIIFCQKWFM